MTDLSLEWTLTDPEAITNLEGILYGSEQGVKDGYDISFTMQQKGRTKTTKTQLLLRQKSPVRRPEWLRDLQDNRLCWKNRVIRKAQLYSVSLIVGDPDPSKGIYPLEVVQNG